MRRVSHAFLCEAKERSHEDNEMPQITLLQADPGLCQLSLWREKWGSVPSPKCRPQRGEVQELIGAEVACLEGNKTTFPFNPTPCWSMVSSWNKIEIYILWQMGKNLDVSFLVTYIALEVGENKYTQKDFNFLICWLSYSYSMHL